MSLQLIPVEDLIKEIESRTHCFICAYELHEDKRNFSMFRFGHNGDWFEAVRLGAILNNDILNDWNGELQTLQRIHKEDLI